MIYQSLLSKNKSYFVHCGDVKKEPPHMHSDTEIIYCTAGRLVLRVNDCDYVIKKNEVFFIKKYVHHEYIVKDGLRLTIQIGSLFLGNYYNSFTRMEFKEPKISLVDMDSLTGRERKLRRLLDEVAEEASQKQAEEISLNLLGNLYKIAHIMLAMFPTVQTEDSRPNDSIYRAVDIIQKHYYESLTIESVAEMVGYGRSSFCYNFKKLTGQSFHHYLVHYRLKMAEHFLMETERSIKDIAYMVGYSDAKTFSQAFKAVNGRSPKSFRDEKQGENRQQR